ncbi:MAG: choice-of-anchor A family protein [Fibrobacter sp.]|nr:choice-of-anchor A family protein [Fibrobacter sp.]
MVRIKFIAGVVTALALVAQVSASFVDVTGGFNVVTFKDFSLLGMETEGAIAAGGNVTIKNSFGVNVNQPLNTTSDAIVAGGKIVLSDNGQVHGDIYATGSISVTNGVTVTGSKYAYSSTLPFLVDYAKANELSSLYDLSASTSAWNLTNGLSTLNLNGTSDVNYYDIDATDLINVWDLSIADQSKYSIINVHGDIDGLGESNKAVLHYNKQNRYNNDLIKSSNILFNFVDKVSLELGSVYGNILAIDADVVGQWGHMEGSLVANSFSGSMEFGMTTFDEPPSQDVPEGSASVMMIAGALMLIVFSRKKFSFTRE